MLIGHNFNTEVYQAQYISVFDDKKSAAYDCSMGIRENLQAELDKRGWNAYDLADASGLPQPTIFRILNGKVKSPRRESVDAIVKALNISEAQLRGLAPANEDRVKARIDSIIEIVRDEIEKSGVQVTDEQKIKLYAACISYSVDFQLSDSELKVHALRALKP